MNIKTALICLLIVFGISAAKAAEPSETAKPLWLAHCARADGLVIYELKSTPTPWHNVGIQFTTISGQRIIITSGSACIFRKVPKR